MLSAFWISPPNPYNQGRAYEGSSYHLTLLTDISQPSDPSKAQVVRDGSTENEEEGRQKRN